VRVAQPRLDGVARGRILAVEPEELASALVRLTEWAEDRCARAGAASAEALREHFGRDPAELPIVARALAPWDRPVDEWAVGRDVEVVGLPVMQGNRAGLAELVRGAEWMSKLEFGAVAHVTVPLGEHESVLCVGRSWRPTATAVSTCSRSCCKTPGQQRPGGARDPS
jgi:hypothetical protein